MIDNSKLEQQIAGAGREFQEAKESVKSIREDLIDLIYEGYAQGISDYEMARLSNVTRDTIRHWRGMAN